MEERKSDMRCQEPIQMVNRIYGEGKEHNKTRPKETHATRILCSCTRYHLLFQTKGDKNSISAHQYNSKMIRAAESMFGHWLVKKEKKSGSTPSKYGGWKLLKAQGERVMHGWGERNRLGPQGRTPTQLLLNPSALYRLSTTLPVTPEGD